MTNGINDGIEISLVNTGLLQDNSITFTVGDMGTSTYNAQLMEYNLDDTVMLTSAVIDRPKDYTLSFKPNGSGVMKLVITSLTNASDVIGISNLYTTVITYTSQNITTTICNNGGDRYRFGFNGMEKDNELKGTGNSLDFGARMYDSRLGRWLSLDPLATNYSYYSPYSSFNNNPTLYVDPTGESGLVSLSIINGVPTATISSFISFYGKYATSQLAYQTALDVQNIWNAANGVANINGVNYAVRFQISGESVSIREAEKRFNRNTSSLNNFVNITEYGSEYGVSSYGSKANTGKFKLSEIISEGSTTEGHEMGHGWGLDHPKHEIWFSSDFLPRKVLVWRGGIMAPKGSIVGIPLKNAGMPMRQEDRYVTQADIDNLGLGNLKYVNGKADLGRPIGRFDYYSENDQDTKPSNGHGGGCSCGHCGEANTRSEKREAKRDSKSVISLERK